MIDLRTGHESWRLGCRAPHRRRDRHTGFRRGFCLSRKRQKAGGSGPPA